MTPTGENLARIYDQGASLAKWDHHRTLIERIVQFFLRRRRQ